MECDLPGELLGCVDLEKRIIYLAPGMDEVRARCTLAFELGQLEQGVAPEDSCLARAYQRAAEEWAARMLIPAHDLYAAFLGSAYLPQIAAMLNVDLPTLRTRLRGMTDEEQDGVMHALRGMEAAA